MCINSDPPAIPKQGFLQGESHLFHIKGRTQRAYELHYHDFPRVVVLLKENMIYIIEGRSYSLRPGDIVLVDRRQVRYPQADASSPYERLILCLSPDLLGRYREGVFSLDSCFSTAVRHHSNVLRLKDEIRHLTISLLKRLEHAQNWQEGELAGPLYCRLLCLQFPVELNHVSLDDNAQYLPNGALNYRVLGLISYINEHLCEDLSIRSLLALNCVSPCHMMHILEEEAGYAIGNYITERRLLKARSLLTEGAGATRACYLSGFNNYSILLRAYKQHSRELSRHSMCAKKT